MASAEDIPLPLDESLGHYLTRLGKTSTTQIRLFDRGDFYSVHNDNALFVANEFLKSPGAIKYMGSRRIPGVAISKLNYEALVRELLLVKQYRVELHAKVESCWKRIAKGSPGNLSQFEDILFLNHEMAQSSGVMCIHQSLVEGGHQIALVYIDVLMKQLTFCEIQDTEQFCMLEALLVQITPKECLLGGNPASPEYQRLSQIFQRLRVSVVPQKSSDFQPSKGKEGLNRLLVKEDGVASKMSSSESLMGSLSCLLKYLELFSDESNLNQFEALEIIPDSYMRLDGAAFNGLNIMPVQPTEPKFASLWGILNNCRTPQGQRLLRQWLKQPLLDINKINERHDIVEAMVEDTQLRQNLAIALKRIPDFFRIAKKVQCMKGTLQDCYKLYMAIKQVTSILDALSSYSGPFEATFNSIFITVLRELEQDFAPFSDLIETTVDLDKCDAGEFVIKPTFDESLGDLRAQLNDLDRQIEDEFSYIAKMMGAEKGKSIKLDFSTYGHCCRVTRKDEKGLRQNKKLEILQTKKDGVHFTSQHLKELSKEFRSLQKNYEEVQSSIVEEVLKVASGYAEPIINLNQNIALMDCLLSFAFASVNAPIPFVRPKVLAKGTSIIDLKDSRHPCVEGNDEINFISNDIFLDKASSSFLVVTGPNMGGKSTYIRQLGIISILAQIGCFVPCSSAKVSVLGSIYARVGATDSQSRGVSTFMAEMLETSVILSTADSDSLIIIDELGRGTSTYDGFGLAWSISNYIIKQVKCLAVFATHFHEMTNLENVQEAAKNYHVSALVEKDSFALLYKVIPGPCDQSFGVHVARLAQFPDHVIKLAEAKSAELDQFQFVPEECLDSEKHSDFIGAMKLIDSLLEELNSRYKAGVRGTQLRDIVSTFLKENSRILNSNKIMSNLVSKVACQVNGSDGA